MLDRRHQRQRTRRPDSQDFGNRIYKRHRHLPRQSHLRHDMHSGGMNSKNDRRVRAKTALTHPKISGVLSPPPRPRPPMITTQLIKTAPGMVFDVSVAGPADG